MHRLVLIAALCLSAVVAVDLGKSDIERRDFGESVERDLGKKSYKSSPDHYKESKDSKSGGGKDSKSGGGSGSKGSKSGPSPEADRQRVPSPAVVAVVRPRAGKSVNRYPCTRNKCDPARLRASVSYSPFFTSFLTASPVEGRQRDRNPGASIRHRWREPRRGTRKPDYNVD